LANFEKTLLSLSVTETERNKDYWATKLKPEADQAAVREADFLILPWEDFRPESQSVFPQGTTDFIKVLRAEGHLRVGLAADRATYAEIALHADEWRLPSVLCTVAVLPVFLNILSSHVDQWLFANPATSIAEQELIIADADGQCFSIRYKGPPTDLVQTFRAQAEACVERNASQGRSKRSRSNRPGRPG
jgi:hypothetical protein